MPQNLVSAIADCKCPRCREGHLFEKTSGSLFRFQKVRPECEVCGLHYEVEPSFFSGAMYVSYAFNVAAVITVFVACYVLFSDPPLWAYLSGSFVSIILLAPFSYNYSRVLYIYAFGGIKYEPWRGQGVNR